MLAATNILIIVGGRNGKVTGAFFGKWVVANQNVTLAQASGFTP